MKQLTIDDVRELLAARFPMAQVETGETSAGFSVSVTIDVWVWTRQALTSTEAALRFATDAILAHLEASA